MMAYLEENSNLPLCPPDDKKRKEIYLDDIQPGVQKKKSGTRQKHQ